MHDNTVNISIVTGVMATCYVGVRLLSPQAPEEDESCEDFAQRVQGLMARSLDLVPTKFRSVDKVEHTKRYLHRHSGMCGGGNAGSVSTGDVVSRQVMWV